MRTLVASLVILVSTTLSAQPNGFQRGDLVRVTPAQPRSDMAARMTLRVVAIAGDRLRIAAGVLYVNDAPASGFSGDFIDRVAQQPGRVPNVVRLATVSSWVSSGPIKISASTGDNIPK